MMANFWQEGEYLASRHQAPWETVREFVEDCNRQAEDLRLNPCKVKVTFIAGEGEPRQALLECLAVLEE